MSPPDFSLLAEIVAKAVREGKPFELPFRLNDGDRPL